ncbi:MAG: hypothetical protein U1D26_03375 [Patescibacteria group bacterium]|nr:hypothetical protein [Patescibacteria group bacterium]
MQSISGVAIRIVCYGLAVAVLAVAIGGMPGRASADVMSTVNQQILPPGANTCPQASATNFTPYIYENALHSFEFTMPDASYVAVIGSVGDKSIALRFMTRRMDASGTLRIHVDTETTPIVGSLPIQVTMLSTRGAGTPVCVSIASATLGSGTSPAPIAASPAPSPAAASPTSSAGTPEETSASASDTSGDEETATSTVLASSAAVAGITKNAFAGLCASAEGAYRLWLVLLVLYVLMIAGLLWPEWPTAWSWVRNPAWLAAWVLAPLVLILAFWYFVPACRSVIWMPITAAVIGAAGLFAAFRNHPRIAQLLLIENKSSTIITPPPPSQNR